eukprot:SAG11_NODE_4571_length_1847_cov_3.699085_4_plen_77_part_00
MGLAAHLEAGPNSTNGGDHTPKMNFFQNLSLARAHTAIALLPLLRLSTHNIRIIVVFATPLTMQPKLETIIPKSLF